MPNVILATALQWGYENSNRVVDSLSEDADIIMTALKGMKVSSEEGEVSLRYLSSSVFYSDAMTIVPGGMCVDLDGLKKDYDALKSANIDVDSLFIDERANLELPFHNGSLLAAEETKKRRSGLRAGDLLDDERLPMRLSRVLLSENKMELFDDVLEKCKEWKAFFSDYIIDTIPVVRYALEADQKVVIEPSGGFMRDVGWASYPITSFENYSAQSMIEKAAIPPKAVTKTIGIAKAYSEATQDAIFPTQFKDGECASIERNGQKLGWLDCIALDYSVYINGVDEMCITNLGAFDNVSSIKVCTGYQIEGEYYSNYPETRKYASARPIYAEFEGWMEDTSSVQNWDELPEKCKEMLKEIGTFINAEITMVSMHDDGPIIKKY